MTPDLQARLDRIKAECREAVRLGGKGPAAAQALLVAIEEMEVDCLECQRHGEPESACLGILQRIASAWPEPGGKEGDE